MALRFSHQRNTYVKHRQRIRLSRFSIVLLLIMVTVVTIGIILILRNPGKNSGSQESAKATVSNYQPNITFTSPYFSFQTDKNWQTVPAESAPDKYVYRAFRNQLVERDLTVYINTLPVNLMLTYVLPVQINGNKLITGDVSQHCRTYLPASYVASSRNPAPVVVENVSFTCQTDGTSVTIGTGLRGNSYQLTMARKNGGNAQYFLLYHDLAFEPRPNIFKDIVSSFTSQ